MIHEGRVSRRAWVMSRGIAAVTLAVALSACDDGAVGEAGDATDATPVRADAQPGPTPDARADDELDLGARDDAAPPFTDAASPPHDAAAVDVDAALAPPDDERPALVICETPDDPGGATEGWRHVTSNIIVLGAAGHSAQDVLAVLGAGIDLPGKFAYGPLSKDLEDEDVAVYRSDCAGGWAPLGRATTDTDGRVGLPLAAADLPAVGRYDVALRVLGDGTVTRSRLWVVPPGTHLMVFDIDGTLTTDDLELFRDVLTDLFQPILNGDYVPEARAGGVELTHLRRVDQGRLLVYLTGRPYVLTDISRGWLDDLGFARGAVHVVDDVAQILPTNGEVGQYKLDFLTGLEARGFVIDAAYGNATTDIFAFAGAGVPAARTFIAGPHGGEGGPVAVGEDWQAHRQAAAAEALPAQSFRDE